MSESQLGLGTVQFGQLALNDESYVNPRWWPIRVAS